MFEKGPNWMLQPYFMGKWGVTLSPADGVIRKPKVLHVLPEVGIMISESFTAHPV
jgi:hypothetical protein